MAHHELPQQRPEVFLIAHERLKTNSIFGYNPAKKFQGLFQLPYLSSDKANPFK